MKKHRITPDPSKAKPSSASHTASQMSNGESQAGELVLTNQGQPTTTSTIVAAQFGKSHKNVLQAIDNALSQTDDHEFNQLNFQPIEIVDSRGRKQRAMQMTEAGFALVAMGFTGQKALKLRLNFIKAFAAATKRIKELERKQADPAWLDARRDTKLGHALIGFALETSRKLAGKETQHFHFANEAKLVSFAMTGESGNFCRDCADAATLKVLHKVEKLNAQLLALGESYPLRKDKCRLLAIGLLAQIRQPALTQTAILERVLS